MTRPARYGVGLSAALLWAAALAGGCQLLVGLDPVQLEPGADGGGGGPPAVCTPDATRCMGTTAQLCDAAGQWQDGTTCPYVCDQGTCKGECVPNDTQCNGDTPQTCDATGKWQSGTPCPFLCNAGACTGTCVPNAMQPCGSAATCNAGMQTCGSDGMWKPCQPEMPCAPTPSGWTPVALTTGACPPGFGSPTAYISGVTAMPYICGPCSCSGTQACAGTATLEAFPVGGAPCLGMPASTMPLNLSTSCAGVFGPTISSADAYKLSNVSFGPGPACTAVPMPTSMPTPVQTNVNVCQADLTCPGGACLTTAEQGALCVLGGPGQQCPPGFPTQTILAMSVQDTRACACDCGSTLSCTFQSLLLDNDSVCGGGLFSITVSASTCVGSTSSFPVSSAQTNAMVTGSGACAELGPSMPTGGVAFGKTYTVCCQ